MKRLLLICALVVMSITGTYAQNDFRKGKWGDSQSEIKKREGKWDISSDSSVYGFKDSIGGKECVAMYAFTDNKFFRGVYAFTTDYSDGKEYIRDFEYLKRLLTMKYGDPDDDTKKWISEAWKDSPDYYGHALYMGDVSYVTIWKTDTTAISLTMGKVKGEISIRMRYDSISLLEDHTAKILEDL